MPKIRFKRGLEATMPQLSECEPGFTTDTGKLFIGSDKGNIPFAKQETVDEIQGIIDGLQTIDANTELVVARGEYSVLGDRLNDLTTNLTEKAQKDEVRENTTTKPILLSELHTEVRQAMTGGSVAVVGENSIGRENYKRRSLDESKTTFLNNKGNLFNKDDILLDGYFLSTGAWSADTAFNSTNYIEIDYGSTYVTNISNRIYSHVVFFDVAKNFVSSIPAGTWSGTINVPNDPAIYYMTFAFYKTEPLAPLMLVKGTALPETYVSYGFVLDSKVELPDIVAKSLIKSNDVNLVTGKNLFDYQTMVKVGKEIGTNAIERDAANAALMDFIPIDDVNAYLYISGLGAYAAGYNRLYSFYDTNKQPLLSNIGTQFIDKTLSGAKITIPKGAKYFRINIYSNKTSSEIIDLSIIQVEYGTSATNFEHYQIYVESIDGVKIKTSDMVLTSGKNLFNHQTMVKVGKEIGTNAIERDAVNSALMDFIPIDDTKSRLNISGLNTYATGYNRLYSFYDANKSPLIPNISAQSILNSVTEEKVVIPKGAKYFRMNIYSNKTSTETFDFSTIMVEYGATASRFEPYQIYVDSINGIKVNNRKLKTNDLRLLGFGDSITETATLSDDGATYTEGTRENWPLYTQATLNFKEMWNYAKSGASYKDRVIGTGTDTITNIRQRITHQVQTAINNNRPGDVIIFAAGANDGNTNMGSYSTAMSKATLADLDKTLLYEAMRWCFWTIQTHYPDALKFVSLPIQRGSYEPIESLNKAIREMGERYGFIVINMTAESQIIRDFEINGNTRDLPDQLHPSKSGHIKMAKVMNRHILNNLNDGF